MKEKIGRLSRGIIDSKRNRIILEPERIDFTISDNEVFSGEFRITSRDRLALRGIVYSSDPHVTPGKMFFAGTDSVISYKVEIDESFSQDAIDGSFSIVSSSGEFSLPYHFIITKEDDRTGEPVATLKDFAEYAATEPDRALSFFFSDDFLRLSFMHNMKMQTLYGSLIKSADRGFAMEEFLIACGQKSPVALEVLNKELTYLEAPSGVQTIGITRSGEGFFRRRIHTDCDFIRIDSGVITDEDFSGNLYQLRFAIDKSRLLNDTNVGHITVSDVRTSLVITINVHAQKPAREGDERRKLLADYTAAHLSLLMNANDSTAAAEMTRAADALYTDGRATLRDILRKIEAAYYSGREDAAADMLNRLAPGIKNYVKKDPEGYVYFHYLVCLVDRSQEKKEALLDIVSKYDTVSAASPSVYIIRAEIDPGLLNNPERLLEGLYRLYDQGVDSPYLYSCALKQYLENPSLIKVLDEFEQQVLLFGVRHRLITLELAREAALLTRNKNDFSDLLFQLMVRLYECFPEPEILTALCAVLIKAGKKDEKYFTWFLEGVEQDLRIAALYDYYLASMPKDYNSRFSGEVYLYYSYNSPSDDHSRELLYRSVLTWFDRDSAIYEAYKKQINEFAIEQLLKSNINENLAVIYEEFLSPEILDEHIAALLPDLLKTCRVETECRGLKRIIICYDELNGEQSMELSNGSVALPVYTNRGHIFFEDAAGNRFFGLPHSISLLMKKNEPLVERCDMLLPNRPLSKLKDIEDCLEEARLSRDQMEVLMEMSKAPGLSDYYRKQMISAIINHHDWKTSDDCRDILVACTESEALLADDRISLIQALGYQGCFEEGWRLTRESSYVNLPLVDLLELCIYGIKRMDYEKDDFVLDIDKYLFKHKTMNDITLTYLCMHYNGLSRDMLRVFKAAVKTRADTKDLPERLLAQMLFSGSSYGLDTVFKAYVREKKTDRMLKDAYYVTKCHNYFIKNDPLTSELAEHITNELLGHAAYHAIPVVMMLAVTKYYSMQETIPERFLPLMEAMVRALVQKNIIFTHFKRLAAFVDLPQEVCDKTVVTFEGEEGLTVVLLLYRNGPGNDPAYLEMNHAYGGIYTRQVLLFNDDHPRYEIRVEKGNLTRVVEVGELYPDITRRGDRLKFSRLDHLLELYSLSADSSWQEELRKYGRDDTLYNELFTTRK